MDGGAQTVTVDGEILVEVDSGAGTSVA
jgi:hypothetical protein